MTNDTPPGGESVREALEAATTALEAAQQALQPMLDAIAASENHRYPALPDEVAWSGTYARSNMTVGMVRNAGAQITAALAALAALAPADAVALEWRGNDLYKRGPKYIGHVFFSQQMNKWGAQANATPGVISWHSAYEVAKRALEAAVRGG